MYLRPKLFYRCHREYLDLEVFLESLQKNFRGENIVVWA
jgi:hypothetical protein